MKKAKQRNLAILSNAPKSGLELAKEAKEESSKPVIVEPDKLSTCKSGLELAGLQPAVFGKHNPNFGNKSLNMH